MKRFSGIVRILFSNHRYFDSPSIREKAVAKDDDPNKIAEKTCCAIGRFIYEFSQLEYTLRHDLGEKIGLEDKYFDAVLCHDFALLCTAIKNVFSKSRGQDFAAALGATI